MTRTSLGLPNGSGTRVAALLGAIVAIGFALGCFESSGSGSVAGTGGASATGGAGGVGGSGAAAVGGSGGTGAGAVGGTGAGGTGAGGVGAGGTDAGGTGSAGTSGDVCADCCAGVPNPQCAVVRCACPPVGGAGAGGTGAGTGGTDCDTAQCSGFSCCGNGTCVNLQNDIRNCGTCGNVCEGDAPYCDGGTCGTPPCDPAILCAGGRCCGTQCCAAGEICCTIPGPVAVVTSCVAPTPEGTCPMGCVLCDCNAPDTPIATPDGERPIASLREGDLVYSVEDEAVVVVPIAIAVSKPVSRHEVVRLTLDDGTVLEVSAGHPLADGRRIGDVRAGADVAGVGIRAAEVVPYAYRFTHDILPASRSGMYYAGGLLVRSTLSP